MPLLDFHFQDLPLLTDLGFEAGEVFGTAELTYLRDGSWQIHSVALDGSKRRPHTEEEKVLANIAKRVLGTSHVTRQLVQLERGGWLFNTVAGVLEEPKWSARIQDAVREALNADHEAALDNAADARRERRREVA